MKEFEDFMDEVIANNKIADECETDLDWEESKYPLIKRYAQNRIQKEVEKKMATLKETAQAYTPKITLNIADLEKVDISLSVEDRTGTDGDGKEFAYKVLVIDDKDYRTPNTAIEEIKKIIALKPDVKFVKVTKQGSGFNTRYSVQVAE